jgi:hypothetical protein
VELALLEARLRVNPDDADAKRRLTDVKAAIKANPADVESVVEVEAAVLPPVETAMQPAPKRRK